MNEDAYAAGLFDGEGTVTMCRNHQATDFRYPMCSMTSTTPELLVFLKARYGGTICHHKQYKSHHKKSGSWRVTYNTALTFLAAVFPYLKEPEKRRRALMLLDEYKKVTPRSGKYTQELRQKKDDFEARFFKENAPV